MPLELGTVLGERYELRALEPPPPGLESYLARDRTLERDVVLKVLWLDGVPSRDKRDELSAKLRREVAALAALEHPNLGRVFDFGVIGAQEGCYVVQEKLGGHSLADEILRGPAATGRARAVLMQILAGLDAAHQQGIVHGSVDATRVRLVVRKDAEGRAVEEAKVLDFGLGKVDERALPSGVELAPDPRRDLRAVGAIAYELLTGAPPIPTLDLATQTSHMPRLDAARPELAGEWTTLVGRALSEEEGAAFPTARALRDALSALEPKRRAPPTAAASVIVPETPRTKDPDAARVVPRWAKLAPLGLVLAAVLGAIVASKLERGAALSNARLVADTILGARCSAMGPTAIAVVIGRNGRLQRYTGDPGGCVEKALAAVRGLKGAPLVLVQVDLDGRGGGAVTAYEIDMDWQLRTTDGGLDRGELKAQLERAHDGVAGCAGIHMALDAPDDPLTIHLSFDASGAVARATTGLNYVGVSTARWRNQSEQVRCADALVRQLRLPPGEGGTASTAIFFHPTIIGRW